MGWRREPRKRRTHLVLSPVRGQPREFPTRPRPATRETRRTSPPSACPRCTSSSRRRCSPSRTWAGRWTHWPRSWCMCPRRRWWARWMRRKKECTRARDRRKSRSRSSRRSEWRRSPRASRPGTSISTPQSCRAHPRRRCRRQSGSTSRRSQSTRARGRGWRRSLWRRWPHACRPQTSIQSVRPRRPQPRRRCRRQPGSTSRRSQSTRARGRGYLMWSHSSHRSLKRLWPRACRLRTSIPTPRTSRPQPRRRCRRQPGSTSRRSQSTRAHDRRRSRSRSSRRSLKRRSPRVCRPRTSI